MTRQDRIEKVVAARRRGLSQGQIARELETTVGAVAGILNRWRAKMPVPPKPAGRPLMELGPRDCRWPFGETLVPATLFCGVPVTTPGPYCDAHRGLAYRQPIPAADG